MRARVYTSAERPGLWERSYDQIAGVWPKYNEQGDILGLHWSRLDEDFRDFQFILYDEPRDLALAQGHSIPCSWDGTVAGLPVGIDGAIDGAVRLFDEGGEPNTLSALAIEIPPEHQGGGLSGTMIAAMREIAAKHGFRNLIAPLRPTWKERYPLTPIERYARWTREDGLPFDPWIRLHVRLGAEILQPVERSLHITGSVAEWEQWTETAFPESGTYVFPRCLATLEIDRAADLGDYWEPNVWVRHPVR
ncbi:MAG: GNAT family N-acetyltransferase [Gaiellaceae bacterium]